VKTKSMSGVKAEGDSGHVTAIFARFNVIDHDGDVTLPGAFEDGAPVRISSYNHGSWGGSLPVGRGVIKVVGDEYAALDGQFFMDTSHGRDTFLTVKSMAELGEWSYGYDTLESESGQVEGEDVNFLKKQKVHEVSPVLLGAGIGTQTLSAKAFKIDDATDDELAEQVKSAVEALLKRGVALPEELIEAVRTADSAEDQTKQLSDDDRGSLLAIAAFHNIGEE